METKTKVVMGFFCGMLSLFLLLLSYEIVLFVTPLSAEQERWMDYFANEKGSEQIEDEYTSLEVSHMGDVKRVIMNVERVFWGVMGILLLLAGYLYRRERLLLALKYGGITAIIGMIVILLWAMIEFNSLFRVFHLLLFPQGNWQFGSDSLLIVTFPIDFFIGMSVKIFGLTLGLAGFIVGGSYLLGKRTNTKKEHK